MARQAKILLIIRRNNSTIDRLNSGNENLLYGLSGTIEEMIFFLENVCLINNLHIEYIFNLKPALLWYYLNDDYLDIYLVRSPHSVVVKPLTM